MSAQQALNYLPLECKSAVTFFFRKQKNAFATTPKCQRLEYTVEA